MTTYSSIIDGENAFIGQLLVPIGTGLSGPTGSLPAAAVGNLAYMVSNPNSIFVANGTDWIQIEGQGATGPGVLPSENFIQDWTFTIGLTGAGATGTISVTQISGLLNNMCAIDLAFNQTFTLSSTGTTGAIIHGVTAIDAAFQPLVAKNFSIMAYLPDDSVYAGAVNLGATGLIDINFTFPVGTATFTVGSGNGVYSLIN